MKHIIVFALAAVIGTVMVGCGLVQEKKDLGNKMAVVEGTVSYRERIALPENAVVSIVLEDVSLADAPAVVLSSQSYSTEGKQVPLAYKLEYQADQIQKNHRYNVRARIEVDGKLRFITDTAFPVITDPQATKVQHLPLVGVR